jgi:hypothetical protein
VRGNQYVGGWTVHVGENASQIFYVYVSDRLEAVEAVRKHVDATSHGIIEARKPVQSTVLAAK